MQIKAYDLMKQAAENPQKYEGKRYKVVTYAVDIRGNLIEEFRINRYGEFVSKGGWLVYIKSDTLLEEIKTDPKPVSFMEAVSSGKRIKHEGWTDFYKIHEACRLLACLTQSEIADRIKGKWLIEDGEEG